MKSVIFKNARIYTMNADQPFAAELRIDGSQITAVGQNLDDSQCNVIDLKGKTMLPGFVDAHCHVFENIQLSGGILLDAMMTKQEVDDTIQAFITAHPDQKNYFGIGYPEWIYGPGEVTRQHLDALCPDKPLFLRSNGGHESWCNTKAFEALHITKDTPDPEGGVFDREEDGMPNGHLNEMALAQLFTDGIEWFDLSQLSQNADKVLGRYAAAGVTGIIDCGCFEKSRETLMDMLSQRAKAQTLTQWISNCCATEYADDFPELLSQLKKESQKYCHPFFFNHTLKVVNDGTVETGTAALSSEMTGGDPIGEVYVDLEPLAKACVAAAGMGMDIHLHGIGDEAVHTNLMAAKAVREAGYNHARITNAHSQFVRSADVPLFNRYNVLANTSTIWHYRNVELERQMPILSDRQFRMQAILKTGGRMTLGSDAPFDETGCAPLLGVEMGVTRCLPGHPDLIMAPDSERLSVWQCLEGYTINAARSAHVDDLTGSLEPGKRADLTILDADPFEVPAEEIHDIPVLCTVMNGCATFKQN